MKHLTPTPTLVFLEGRRLPVAWLFDDDRLVPIVRGGADGDGGDGAGGEGAGAGEGEGGGAGGEGAGGTGGEGDGEGTEGGDGAEKVTLTQAELQKMIDKAAGRAAKAKEKEINDAKAAEDLSEVDRLKAELAERNTKDADKEAVTNARLVKADAKLVATAEGVNPERVGAFLKTLDLSDIDVDEDGEVDQAALTKAIKDGPKAIPEFKGTNKPGRMGGDGFDKPGDEKPATSLEAAVAKRLAKTG